MLASIPALLFRILAHLQHNMKTNENIQIKFDSGIEDRDDEDKNAIYAIPLRCFMFYVLALSANTPKRTIIVKLQEFDLEIEGQCEKRK